MNVSLPPHACPPACQQCRLRKTGAFTPVKPEVLDFIEGFRTDSLAVEAGGALVRESQTNAKLFTLYSGWAFRYKTLSDGRRQILNFLLPGDLVVGADSHTCTYGALGAFATGMGSTDVAVAMATGRTWLRVPETIRCVYTGPLRPWVGGKDLILHTIGLLGVDGARYKALEFAGPAIDALSMDGRLTMANMAIEAGAKAGLVAPDETTLAYVRGRARRPYRVHAPDPDATYASVLEIDASRLEPQVAFPHLPDNVRPAAEAGDVPIDQVVIGSCTNGRLEDLRVAAAILRGRRVHPRVRCIVIPGSQQVYLDALKEGLLAAFVEAGAAVSTPTCGPCLGGHMGVLAAGERAVSTTNRNFRGRMGHTDSEVYLAGPAVAAASAIAGRIAAPEGRNP